MALIVGPTASGKSALALELAKKQPSVIINADSAQVYSDLQILSARPSMEDMEDQKHELYGYIGGEETCSAARWANDAKAAIAAAHKSGVLPILVGGTGLYVRTLLDGIAPIPSIQTEIRTEIRLLETTDAFAALTKEDPVSAARLHPADTTRIMRALEVVRSTGKPLDHWHKHKSGGISDQINLRAMVLLPPRDWLYSRCDLRFSNMLAQGAKAEVEALKKRGFAKDLPVLRAIGVTEISDWIDGRINKSEAVERAQIATRQYAKRQFTWFRNQSPAHWPRWKEEINNDNIDKIVI